MGYLQEHTDLPEPHIHVSSQLARLVCVLGNQPAGRMAILDMLFPPEDLPVVNNFQKSGLLPDDNLTPEHFLLRSCLDGLQQTM